MVSYTLETLPPLTGAQIANLRALAARPDSEIDTSGSPVMTDEQWANAPRRYHPHRPTKRQITARVDADVLDWLKSHGKAINPASTPSSDGRCSRLPSKARVPRDG